MRLDTSGKNVEVTDSLRHDPEEKMGRAQRHLGQDFGAHGVLALEERRPITEVNLRVAGAGLCADAGDKDMYAAIDAMVDKIDRQARRYHEKAQYNQRF